MSEKNNLEKHLVIKIKSLYNTWQGFANIVEQNISQIEQSKKDIASKLISDPDSEDMLKAFEAIQYEIPIQMQDKRSLETEFIHLYSLADEFGITDQFTESLNEKMQKLISDKPNTKYVLIDGKLEERVKGEKDKYIEEVKNSPTFKTVLKLITENLNK